MKTVLVIFVLIVAGVWSWDQNRSISQPDGQLAPKMPVQRPLGPKDPKFFKKENWSILPLEKYSIRARVLSRERYLNDGSSDISPVDFALGWGPMSDNKNLDGVSIKQRHRWFFVGDTRADQITDMHFAANTHIIPADEEVRKAVLSVREGHVIEAEGYLVECIQGNNPPWRSSLSRTDVGDGACEIFYVESISILDADDVESMAQVIAAKQIPRPGPKVRPVTPVKTQSAATEPPGLEDKELPLQEQLNVTAVNNRGAIINGTFCKIGRTVSGVDGVYLIAVSGETLHFETLDGEQFSIVLE